MATENTMPPTEAADSGTGRIVEAGAVGPGSSSAEASGKRITADFSPDAYKVLTDTAAELHISKAEALRKALGLIYFVIRQQKDGWTLILEKGDKRKEIVTL